MNAGEEFEFNQAQHDLEESKSKLKEYLRLTYKTQKEADTTYSYLESVIIKVCKHQEYRLTFGGGNPIWHARVLNLLSEWIRLENKVGMLISKEISYGDASS